MKSKLADDARRDLARRALKMTAGERVEAALALGEQALVDYMENFGIDRERAMRDLRRAGQAGRRYSACMDVDSDVWSKPPESRVDRGAQPEDTE